MPSYLHELLLVLFRNRNEAVPDLLRGLDVQLPEYDQIQVESSNLSNLQPTEYRADHVLFLAHGSRKVLGVIVEVQLGCDEDKSYTWPTYIANLRARHRCPVCLLVITVEEAVARWAGRAIELGPGTRCAPWVVGPSNTPAVTELKDAEDNVELAVLSAVEHGQCGDGSLAARVASTAIVASAGLDADRASLYLDLISIFLVEGDLMPEAAPNPLTPGFEYQSGLARRNYARGKADVLVKLLSARFGPLSEEIEARVRGAKSAQMDDLVEPALTAKTVDEAVASLL